jgi:hypothetical protein
MLIRATVLLAWVIAGAGCGHSGPELGDVQGTVRLDGQVVQNLQVEFQPAGDGAPSYGVTDVNGQYSLQYSPERMGAIVGTHKVRVTGEYYDSDTQTMKKVADIPPRYNSESELTVQVTGKGDTLDFDLQCEES